ncbi:MAG: TlpA family protein disulfide reductase, partial [Muribaculaceae bacterium]|nr:TlpA family protein disulfide reductase [Muribaculaceae bacterium]
QKEGSKAIGFTLEADKPLIRVGDSFPRFAATDIDGRTWTNADVEGRVMVLNLWFTGCGPCRREMPELSTWKDEMPEVMFFSSTYEAPEIARQVLDKGHFNWIPLVNDTQFKEWIGGNGYPLTIVVDKSGKIAAYEYGTSPEQRASLKKVITDLR